MITAEKLAKRLNGRGYMDEMSEEEEQEACDAGIVVVFGYSDDLMEFRGAIDDEIGCYDGGSVRLTSEGILRSECDEGEDCPYFKKLKLASIPLNAIWDKDGYSWVYETDIPHSMFDIMGDGEKYCRGIVFEMSKVMK
jgi:hypothetical protein